eukprot:TRINITY_DN5724_c0_g1_i3.p1 TRINITY_DN5724_c0_g1~~TRINITY_DN5724_c0_g1_i3.p1  ORF type:complete len:627 (-),score=35.91 TRINITY_DN5724_c0_g1_i3:525-2405(-)
MDVSSRLFYLLSFLPFLLLFICINGQVKLSSFANGKQDDLNFHEESRSTQFEFQPDTPNNQVPFQQVELSVGSLTNSDNQVILVDGLSPGNLEYQQEQPTTYYHETQKLNHHEYEQIAQQVVLLGEDPTTCNVLGDLEVEGSEVWMGPNHQYVRSAQECCILCKSNEDCNAWTWCSNPEGCNGAKESYTQCKLKYDKWVAVSPRWKHEGMGWISGFTKSNCPAMSVFDRQRVDYSHFQNTCQDKHTMCTTCMCSLYQEFEKYNGKPEDLGLCMESIFLGTLRLPYSMGGSNVDEDAVRNLQSCPTSSNPCISSTNAVTFYSPRIAFNAKGIRISDGHGSTCHDSLSPLQCAQACNEIQQCDAFEYNPVKQGGLCCFLGGGTSREVWFDSSGWQTYFRMERRFDPNRLTWQNPIKVHEIEVIPDLSDIIVISTEERSNEEEWEDSITLGYGCGACHDEPPPNSPFSCQQFKDWDLCDSIELTQTTIPNGYCALTCDRCGCNTLPSDSSPVDPGPIQSIREPLQDPCFCSDVSPPQYTCQQVNDLGLCNKYSYDTSVVAEGYCQITCGRCDCPSDKLCVCSDVQPPGVWDCEQQKFWNKCDTMWMGDSPSQNGYCQITCGGCPCVKYD